MGEIQLLDGTRLPVGEDDPYSTMNAGITFSPADLLDRKLKDEYEAKALSDLVNMYFGSEMVYDQLRVFVNMYFDKQLEVVKAEIVSSSNGEDTGL